MSEDLDDIVNSVRADEAGRNIGVAAPIQPSAAQSAFKSAPFTNVDPSVGMHASNELDEIAQSVKQEGFLSNPIISKFASRSPAHVAATRNDWPNLTKVGDLATQVGAGLAEGLYGIQEQLMRQVSGAPLMPTIGPRVLPRMPQELFYDMLRSRMSSMLPEQPTDQVGKAARTVGNFLPAAAFPGGIAARATNVLAPAIGTRIGAEVGKAVGGSEGEQLGAVAGGLLGGVAPAFRTGQRMVVDLGDAKIVGDVPEGPQKLLPGPARPGVRPEETSVYRDLAKQDADAVAKVEDSITQTSTHKDLPEVMQEFLQDTPVSDTQVWVDPRAVLKLYSEGHQPFQGLSTEIGAALNAGQEVQMPLSTYLAEVSGKPWAEELRNATRFREDGVSVNEAEGLAEPKAEVEGEAPLPALKRESVFPEDVAEFEPELRTIAANVDSSVDQIFQEQALASLFDPKALKLSEARFAEYDNQIAEAKAAARERVLEKVYKQIRKERTSVFKERLAARAEGLRDEINQLPSVEAWRQLTTKGYRIDRDTAEAFSPGLVAELPASLFKNNGNHPDDVAEYFGYSSGAELLSVLGGLRGLMDEGESLDKFVKRSANDAALKMLRTELGFDLSPEGIMDAAREAVVFPGVEELLAKDLQGLGELAELPYDRDAVKLQAEQLFQKMPVSQAANLKFFERAMWSTGERAARALEKGDFARAFVERQQQVLNFHQLEMAHFLKKKIAQAEKKFKRLTRDVSIPGMAQPFLDQLHRLLPLFGFPHKRNPIELAEALGDKSLWDFVAETVGTNANFPAVPDVDPAPLAKLSVADFWSLRNFVFAMDRYGRDLKKALKEEGRADFDEVVEQAIAAAPPGKPPKPTLGGDKGFVAKTVEGLRNYDAAHRKAADMLEIFDHGNHLGIWAQNTTIPMSRAADVESKLTRDIYEPVVKAWNKIPDKTKKGYSMKLPSPFSVQGTQVPVLRQHVLMFALYTGTEESLQKAAEGYGVEAKQLLDWINQYITPEEVDFVETIWQKFEDLGPQVSKVLRNLTGTGLRYVAPTPVELGGRRLRGGYWPIKYNTEPGMNPTVLKWEQEREAELSPEGVDELFASLMPNKGFSKERTSYVGPVDVDVAQIGAAFNSHIKYAAYAQAVSDVRKFIYDPRIAATVLNVMGPEYMAVVPDWINGIVKPFQADERLLRPLDQAFNTIARLFSIGTLTFNYTTLVGQAASAANAIGVLGDGNILQGFGRLVNGYGQMLKLSGEHVLTNGTSGIHDMFERSEFMRHRYGNVEQNATEALMDLQRIAPGDIGLKKSLHHLEQIGFQLIGWVEFISASGPTWLAAEQKALAAGESAEAAVTYANRIVLKSQGGSRKVDLAAVQRAQGLAKLLYAFQSYFNQQYQLGVDVYRNFGGGNVGPPRGPEAGGFAEPEEGPGAALDEYSKSRGFLLFLTVFILATFLGNLLTHRKSKPTDPIFNAFRPLFGLNTLTDAIDRHVEVDAKGIHWKTSYDTKVGNDILGRLFETLIRSADNIAKVAQGKTPSRPVQNTFGLLQAAGVPGAAQAGKTGEYLYQVSKGKQSPKDWIETYFGLTGGPKAAPKKTESKSSSGLIS